MFEIECILDEGSWELAGCQISTIICLLALKQIRLGVPEVPGPLHTCSVEFSVCVTSLMEIHFNLKKIHAPLRTCSQPFLICFQGMQDTTLFSPEYEKYSSTGVKYLMTFLTDYKSGAGSQKWWSHHSKWNVNATLTHCNTLMLQHEPVVCREIRIKTKNII